MPPTEKEDEILFRRGHAIKRLVESEGWLFIKGELEARKNQAIAAMTRALTDEDDYHQAVTHAQKYRDMESVISLPDALIAQGQAASQRLEAADQIRKNQSS